MSSSDDTLIQSISEAGIAAEHPPLGSLTALVAPAMEERFNTIRPPLSPIACWSIGDARFLFGSSFVRPEIAEDVMSLAALVRGLEEKHGKRPVASVFGHADPVGYETHNKGLSGRRAAAIYALLTQRVDIWEDIYSQKGQYTSSLSADDWGYWAIDTILADLGYAGSSIEEPPESGGFGEAVDPVTAFQRDHGLVTDGVAGPNTREKLFGAYMAKHCRTREGEAFKLEAGDFLARGDDAAGKGDYQGCSEFNPLLIFSEEEYREFSRTEKKAERDTANAPNRRVIVFLFDPQASVQPYDWPCPRAKEGLTACKKRLWSDAKDRARCGAEPRRFEETGDTLACRFYERFGAGSPCERSSLEVMLRIRLYDVCHRAMGGARYRLTLNDNLITGEANSDGFVEITVAARPHRCLVEWDHADADHPEQEGYAYQRNLHLDYDQPGDPAEQAKRRLSNLGYPVDMSKPLEQQQAITLLFQLDYPKCEILASTDDPAAETLSGIHDQCKLMPRSASL